MNFFPIDIKSSESLFESTNSLLIVIAVMGAILFIILIVSCVLIFFCTRQLRLSKRDSERNRPGEGEEENFYDNIEMYMGHQKDDIYSEIYEPMKTKTVKHKNTK